MEDEPKQYESVLEIARTLREQIDWQDVRAHGRLAVHACVLHARLGVAQPERVSIATPLRLTR